MCIYIRFFYFILFLFLVAISRYSIHYRKLTATFVHLSFSFSNSYIFARNLRSNKQQQFSAGLRVFSLLIANNLNIMSEGNYLRYSGISIQSI
jgi:disulfide bond formation protein DsbB